MRWLKKKKRLYVEMHRQSVVSFYPEVETVVEILSKKLPLAIVTAGHEDQLRATVPEYFLNRFTAIVCGDKVKKNKPNPDPYITACRELQILPEHSIVVENAPLGVESAVSAGCYCIGVTSTCEPSTLFQAHELIPKISDIFTAKVLKSSFSC